MASFTNLSLAQAKAADLPALIELAVEAFGEPVRELAQREFPTGLQSGLRSPLALIVAKEGDTPIGMVGLLQDFSYPDTFCLSWLAVAPACQRQGLGSALIQAAIHGTASVINGPTGTLILATAKSKQAYYIRHGFTGGLPLHAHPHHAGPHVMLARPITKAA